MNEAHILGKKRNRIKRIQKLLTNSELPVMQRERITQRMAELLREAK